MGFLKVLSQFEEFSLKFLITDFTAVNKQFLIQFSVGTIFSITVELGILSLHFIFDLGRLLSIDLDWDIGKLSYLQFFI